MKSKPTYEELEQRIVALKKQYDEVLEQKAKPCFGHFANWKEIFQVLELVYDDNEKVTDYYYREMTPSFERLLGKEREQLIDKRVKEIFGTVEQYWLEVYRRVDSTGEAVDFVNYNAELETYYNVSVWQMEPHVVGVVFKDVTERKAREKKLVVNSLLSKDVEKIAQMGHWKLDIINDSLFWSDETFRIFDLEPQQFDATYEAFLEYIHPEDREKVNKAYTQSLKDKKPYEIEHRLLLNGGIVKYVIERGHTKYDKSGAPLYSIGTVHDLTESKKAEHELFLLKEKYRIIADNTYDWEYWKGVDDEYIYISPSVEKVTGYEALAFFEDENLLNKIIHPEDKALFSNHKHSLSETGGREPIEFRILAKDKSIRWVGHVCQEVYGINGEYLGIRGGNRDITSRKKLEQDLKESEEKFRSFYNDITLAVVVYDVVFDSDNEPVNFICVDVNPMYEELTHLKKEDILGKTIKEFIPQLEDKWIQILGDVVRTEEPASTVQYSSFLNKYWDTKAFKTINNQLVVTFSDMTERVRAEEELKESRKLLKISEDRLSKTWLAANDGMYDWDLITNEVYFDPRYYEMAGYAINEFPHHFDEFQKRIHPDDVERVMNQASLHLAGKTDRFNVEFRLKRKDGDWLWVMGRGLIVERDQNNKPLRFFGTHTDITDRIASDRQLKESKEHLLIAQDISNTGMWIYDIASQTFSASPETLRIYGFAPMDGEYTIERVEACLPDRERVHQALLDLITDEREYNLEFEVTPVDGSRQKTIVSIAILERDRDGQPNKVVGFIQDITERKQDELTIVQKNSELKELNATKDKFFSIIAHDLKSPFNSVLGFSDILYKDFDKYNSEEKKRFIGLMYNSVNRAYKLLNNLLLWSSSQRGKIVFNPEEINLYLLAVESEQIVNQAAEEKSIVLLNDIPKDICLNADRNMLSVVIRNLLSNAVKFTPRGGEICISASLMRDDKNKEKTKITVSDNGVGIPTETQLKLFGVGQNTSTKGTDKETGTGLGLILCKEFVERHGGEIGVNSEVGKGSEFVFSIPCI